MYFNVLKCSVMCSVRLETNETDRSYQLLLANQPDVVVVDKRRKTAVVIDVAKVGKRKEHEKLKKNHG